MHDSHAQLQSANTMSAETEGLSQGQPGASFPPPAFQLKAEGQTSKGGGPQAPIQRVPDSREITGNVSSSHGMRRNPSDQTNLRIIERIAQIEGDDPAQARERYEAMSEEDRATAMEQTITRFQHSEQGQALITQILQDNNVQDGRHDFYDRPESERRGNFQSMRAGFQDGAVTNNDATMQALANAWPRNMFGNMVTEEQAYHLIHRLVNERGLPFDASKTNVISVRGFQGGEIHDNNEGQRHGPFSRTNLYNDTTYILSLQDGEPHVVESRSTVDPGDATNAARQRNVFRVEADQQWDYSGNSRGHTQKFDRPMYGLANREEVTRGRYWQENPAELAAALEGGHAGSRVLSDRNDRQFPDVNPRGRPNRVSALHSGGRGSGPGDRVMGDSTGCTVVHGAWFAHFNESLRRASGEENATRFTYTLLDLSLFEPAELRNIVASETRGTCNPDSDTACN